MTLSGPRLYVSLAAALTTASCRSSTTPTAPETRTAEPARRQIVVLGDSLAVSPSLTQSFPAALQARLDAAHPGWTMRNAGVNGDTTARGAARMEAALTSETAILILELGANDGLRGVEIADIERNLSGIIERAQAGGIRVLLCGMETPPFRGFNYSLEFHRLYPRLAARYGVPSVPFLLEGVALNPELNGDDGIHPNAAGAGLIAETVWPYLEPLIAQAAAS